MKAKLFFSHLFLSYIFLIILGIPFFLFFYGEPPRISTFLGLVVITILGFLASFISSRICNFQSFNKEAKLFLIFTVIMIGFFFLIGMYGSPDSSTNPHSNLTEFALVLVGYILGTLFLKPKVSLIK